MKPLSCFRKEYFINIWVRYKVKPVLYYHACYRCVCVCVCVRACVCAHVCAFSENILRELLLKLQATEFSI